MGVLLAVVSGRDASAQFLRLGPFDFTAQVTLEGVYTTNVEGQRVSDAKEKREDYYTRLTLGLDSTAEVSDNSTIVINLGMGFEAHANRPDLDTYDAPFSRSRIDYQTEMGYYTLMAKAFFDRTAQEIGEPNEDIKSSYIPGNRKRISRYSTYGYGSSLRWNRDPLQLMAEYENQSDRYDDEEFTDGDNDEEKFNTFARWQVREEGGIFYRGENTKTHYLNNPGAKDGEWVSTRTIGSDLVVPLLRRPKLVFSFGLENEETEETDGEWDPFWALTLTDSREISRRTRFSYFATRTWESDPEEDDVGFTYGLTIDQDLNSSLRHSFTASREPVETFGSTTETDSTDYRYTMQKMDLLIPELSATLTLGYGIDKPVNGPEEKKKEYRLSLNHRRSLSRRLDRSFIYEYMWEDSNLETEILDEHRFSLIFNYRL